MRANSPLANHLDLFWEISKQADGFEPKSPAGYDPQANGFWSPWPLTAYPCEAWRVLPFALPQRAEPPPLMFEHLSLPRLDEALEHELKSEGVVSTDVKSTAAIGPALVKLSQAQALANHMLRKRIPLRLSGAAQRFLAYYPDIPKAHAGLLRAGYLGGALPLRLFAAVVWADTLKVQGQTQTRLFRQPIDGAGIALGVCQSFPIDPVSSARWIGN